MNRAYEQVKEFHTACGIEMPSKPTLLGDGEPGDIANKITAGYLDKACRVMKSSKHGGEVNTRTSYMLEELAEFLRSETIEDQADALGDLIYFAIGTYTLMGLKPENIFNEIHAANMRKVIDGKVLRNEQGKIVKPEGWYGPESEIRKEIERQNETTTC